MSDLHLHIVSMDVPYPPVYGGIIDVYYCVKGFYDAGIKVHLHCFEYGRGDIEGLKNVCESLTVYKRSMSPGKLFNIKPFIVTSRISKQLNDNLGKDDCPILLQGLHCTSVLADKRFNNRTVVVRTHNVEHDYYGNLAEVEKKLLTRIFFRSESIKLKFYENVLNKADGLASISKSDYEYFSNKYKNVNHVSAFHPYSEVKCQTGRGDFALYHGNLSVSENDNAAKYLIREIFNDIDVTLVIAGNNPGDELRDLASKHSNVRLESNLTLEKINELLLTAHINILPTFQATGIKLKLLAALYMGRWCIVNNPMVENTGLENLAIRGDKPEELKSLVKEYFQRDFSKEDIVLREEVLSDGFGNKSGIEKLKSLLFTTDILENKNG